jgi:hypothetical protein
MLMKKDEGLLSFSVHISLNEEVKQTRPKDKSVPASFSVPDSIP